MIRHRRKAVTNLASARISWATALISNAILIMVMVFLLKCCVCRTGLTCKEAKHRLDRETGKVKIFAAMRGKAAQAPARKRTALDVARDRLKPGYTLIATIGRHEGKN